MKNLVYAKSVHVVTYSVLLVIAILRINAYSELINTNGIIRISSVVSSEPTYYEFSQGIRLNGVRVYLPLNPRIEYRDKIILEGKVEDRVMKNPTIILHEKNSGSMIKLRNKLLTQFTKNIPTPHSGLVAGMVIGSKELISSGLWDQLIKTGTAHVVVASGMNVVLVAGFMMHLSLKNIKRKYAICITLGSIWMYALLVGFEAPIIRASFMASIAFMGQLLGRVNNSWNILIITSFVMLIVSPEYYVDVGFYLSVMATAGLMAFAKPIHSKVSFLPPMMREDFATTIAAQIGVFPILWFVFGTFSLRSIAVNTLILWTVVPITILSSIFAFVGLVLPELSKYLFVLVYPFTYWFISFVDVFSF